MKIVANDCINFHKKNFKQYSKKWIGARDAAPSFFMV